MPIRCCRHLNGCPSELSRVLKKLTWYADMVRLPYHPQHTLNFLSPDKCRCEQKAHPRLGACQSEKQELELARSLCDSGSITNIIVRQLFKRVEKKRSKLRRWS